MQELKDRVDARMHQIKLALLTANPGNISLLFPDVVPPKEQTIAEIDDALADSGPVEYRAVDASEAQDMMAILSRAGVLNTEDLPSIDTTSIQG